ncbi:hypothetical protein C2I18_07590 [Paenibacillus sp. PK3_47]|uniref:thioredoxin family protein n=1 Tax=Paenibacillus sp. PK3_47 TaxID=2072642 RepID=UPI00201D2D12|nr:thioredoxin family protein [Paenibacillus sp. PK3_47]UQZ33431.1 hypothetical protein C2I18_07590 [Paenibacillus sp. PK3_47]
MRQTIDKILLFTLSACPMGRSMKTVLEEWLASENEYGITFDVIYVDVDPETTNRYRIKVNPTTIFLDGDSMELYRIEGFKEIEDVRRLTNQLKKGLLSKKFRRKPTG